MSKVTRPGMLAIGLWLLFLAVNPGRNETLDVEMRRLVARQIWTTGEFTVASELHDNMGAWIPVGPGRWAAPYGVGQSLLLIPFDILGAALETVAPQEWRDRAGWIPIGLGLLPLLGVFSWYSLRSLLTAWGFARPWPVVGAIAMTLGTILFHYSGQAQEEILVAIGLAWAVTFALRLRLQRTYAMALMSGACAGGCLVVRPVSVFAVLVVPVLVASAGRAWSERCRLLLAFGAAGLAVSSLALLYNFARFGSLFTVGYDRLGHFSKLSLDARTPKVILSLLLGPGAGLLVLSPLLLILFFGARDLLRRDPWYTAGALVAVSSCYLFFGSWHDSYLGGTSWGTRYQCHLLPLLAIPVTLGLQRLNETHSRRRIAGAIVAVTVVIQFLSVFCTHHLEPFQSSCDDASESVLRNSPVRGQLERRATNVVHWAVGAPAPDTAQAACRAPLDLMWDRYVPNFWGPVFAHRLAGARGWALLAAWAVLAIAAVFLTLLGIRREVLIPR